MVFPSVQMGWKQAITFFLAMLALITYLYFEEARRPSRTQSPRSALLFKSINDAERACGHGNADVVSAWVEGASKSWQDFQFYGCKD